MSGTRCSEIWRTRVKPMPPPWKNEVSDKWVCVQRCVERTLSSRQVRGLMVEAAVGVSGATVRRRRVATTTAAGGDVWR